MTTHNDQMSHIHDVLDLLCVFFKHVRPSAGASDNDAAVVQWQTTPWCHVLVGLGTISKVLHAHAAYGVSLPPAACPCPGRAPQAMALSRPCSMGLAWGRRWPTTLPPPLKSTINITSHHSAYHLEQLERVHQAGDPLGHILVLLEEGVARVSAK